MDRQQGAGSTQHGVGDEAGSAAMGNGAHSGGRAAGAFRCYTLNKCHDLLPPALQLCACTLASVNRPSMVGAAHLQARMSPKVMPWSQHRLWHRKEMRSTAPSIGARSGWPSSSASCFQHALTAAAALCSTCRSHATHISPSAILPMTRPMPGVESSPQETGPAVLVDRVFCTVAEWG